MDNHDIVDDDAPSLSFINRQLLASSGVYISGFDKSLFAEISAEFGVPFLVSLAIAAWFLSQAYWNFGLLAGAISGRSWAFYASPWAVERWLPCTIIYQWIICASPIAFLFLWGIMVARHIAVVLGVAIIMLGLAGVMVTFGIFRWRHNGWRVDNAVRWSFGLGGSLVLIYELYIVFANAANNSYSYLGFSFVFITLNMLPLIAVNYLLAQAVAKPISLYALLDDASLLRPSAPLPGTTHSSDHSDDTKQQQHGNVTVNVGKDKDKDNEHSPLLTNGDGVPYEPLNSPSTRVLRIGLTVVSILVLFAYGTVVQVYSSDGASVGWITMAAILVCDMTIYMCVFGAKIDSPSQTCCFQIMARIILVIPGDNYWFIGHSFMYFLLACFFATCIVDTHSPQLSDRQRVSAAVTDKIAEGEHHRGRDRAVMALDEARRKYWLKMGKFFESKVGQWLQFWVDVCALAILTLFFAASLLLNAFISDTSLVLWDVSHAQYIVGIVTLFVVAVFAMSHAIYRHYRNNEYKITLWVAAWTLLLYACIIGAAIGLYNLTSSVTLLCLCCYMPAILILSAESYRWWRANDYHLLQPIVTAEDVARHKRQQSEFNNVPVASRATSMSTTSQPSGNGSESKTPIDVPGEASGGLDRKKSVEVKDEHVVIPPLMQQMMDIVRKTNHTWLRDKVIHMRTCADYGLTAMILFDIILIAAMGWTISYYSTPTYIGYSISAILLIIAGTAIPIMKWFNLYRMTGLFIPCIIFTTITLASWLTVLWYVDLVAYVDDGTYTRTNALLALVGLALLYPVVVLLIVCFYQYRDSGWKIRDNLFVPVSFGIACSLVIGYFISVTVLYSTIWGMGALALFIVIVVLVVIAPGVTNIWALRIIYGVLVLAGIGFALFIAIYPDTGYIGFSIFVGVIFLAILGRTFLLYRDQFTSWFSSVHDNEGMKQFQSPGDILPVFIYNANDTNSPVQAHSGRVWLVYSLLAIAWLWGVLEVFFVAGSSFAIGVGVSCVCILIATWFTFEGTTASLIAFHKAVTYLEEGSARYVDTIQQVKGTIEQGFFNRMAAQGLISEEELRASRGNGKVARSVDGVTQPQERKSATNVDFKGSYWSTLNWTHAWQHLWQAYISMPPLACCYCSREDPVLDFRDIIALLPQPRPTSITRVVAWQHIMRFNRDLSTVYKLRAEFVAGIMFEVFHNVHHQRMEDEHEMISMLQSIGYVDVTPEMFSRLPSSIRDQLGDLYQAFKRNRQAERDVSAKRRNEAQRQEVDRDRALKLLPAREKYGLSLGRQGSDYKPTPHDGLDFIEYLKRTNITQWIDPDLPGAKLLFKKPKLPGEKSKWDKYKEFARPEVFLPSKTPVIFQNMNDLPDRIKQGAIGDCYVMSALSVLAEHRRDQLKKMILTDEHGAWGAYAVQFYVHGRKTTVVVDSAFPVDDKKRQAFARSTIPEELWVSIIEKAYAKLYSSYEAIESGFVDQALIDMTGGIGSRIDMTKPEVKQKIRNGQLWTTILSYRNNGYLMGAGTPAGSDDIKNASAMGIVQGHAYAILDVVEIDEHKLIQLRNPWGKFEWKGDWSDKSDKWTTRLKTKLNVQDIDDGKFWMSFLDFSRHFEDIYICRFFDTPNWHATEIDDEWKGITAGGCTNEPECIHSPQYALMVTEPTQFIISLSQEDRRSVTAGGKYPAIAIEVYNNDGKRVSDVKCGTLVATNPESYIFRREVLVECFLEPSRHPYTVLVSTYDKGQEAKFLVRVYGHNARRSYTFTALPKEKVVPV